MHDPAARPRVGISRCLLGEAVRYDGGHKRQPLLLALLGPHVEWVPVCPEVELGMGTPREPIELVPRGTDVRMIGVTTQRDWTGEMRTYAGPRVDALRALDLAGYVFKAGSPSCNLHGRRGLFAEAVLRAMPALAVADEGDLRDAAGCEAFLARVRAAQGGSGWHPGHQ